MSDLLAALSVIFIVAGALLLVANHYSLATVPFFILAGFIATPFIDQALILELAQWGIAFLVFVFGVQLNLSTIGAVIRDSEIITVVVTLVMGAFGFGIAWLVGFDSLDALYFAIAAALSSTIVGAGMLQEEIRNNLVHGRLAESIHFLQDLIAIGLILVLSADAFTADAVSSSLGYGVMLVSTALVINTYLFDRLTKFAEGSQELQMIGAISILIGFIAAAEFFDVSIVVGAFAAGIAIKRDFTKSLGMLNGIESIKDFFVAIFFVTLGALVLVRTPNATVILMASALFVLTAVVKPVATALVLLREGYDARAATLTSLSLDQVSEFALIIAIEATILGVLAPELFDAIILAAAVSMITSSYSRKYDDEIYRTITRYGLIRSPQVKTNERSRITSSLTDHVVIVGFGRLGRRLAARCESIGRSYVVVENDPLMLEGLAAECPDYVFGDAMHNYTWEMASVDRASLVISTVDDTPVSDWILSLDVEADVLLRAATPDEARQLLDGGALYVIVPDLLASDGLLTQIQVALRDGDRLDRLRTNHLEELVALERVGFTSMAFDVDRQL